MLTSSSSNLIRRLCCALALVSSGANAAVYTYQGSNYTVGNATLGLTTAMTVNGTFDYAGGRLGNSVSNANLFGQLATYSFNTGVATFTQSNSTPCIFRVSTDASGNISEYVISLRESPAPAAGNQLFLDVTYPNWAELYTGTAPTPGTGNECAMISPNNSAYTMARGTWTAPPAPSTAVPALSAYGLVMFSGVLMLGAAIFLRRRA
jgi:hypothetical protein